MSCFLLRSLKWCTENGRASRKIFVMGVSPTHLRHRANARLIVFFCTHVNITTSLRLCSIVKIIGISTFVLAWLGWNVKKKEKLFLWQIWWGRYLVRWPLTHAAFLSLWYMVFHSFLKPSWECDAEIREKSWGQRSPEVAQEREYWSGLEGMGS